MHHAADATGVDQVMITDSRPQPPVFRSLVQDTRAALAAPAGQSLFASMRQAGIDWPYLHRKALGRHRDPASVNPHQAWGVTAVIP